MSTLTKYGHIGTRELLEAIIEQALGLLDELDGDCDLEAEPLESELGGAYLGLDDLELDMADTEIEEPTEFYPEGSWLRGGADAA